MHKKKIILINQAVGKLFYELSLGLSSGFEEGGKLIYGELCDRDLKAETFSKLKCFKASSYNKSNNLTRFFSWISFLFSILKYIINSNKSDLFLITSNPLSKSLL